MGLKLLQGPKVAYRLAKFAGIIILIQVFLLRVEIEASDFPPSLTQGHRPD